MEQSLKKHPKEQLTKQVIDEVLDKQRAGTFSYIFRGILMLAILGCAFTCGQEYYFLMLLLLLPFASLVFLFIKDLKIAKKKYVVLERTCVKKKFINGYEYSDKYLLYFMNLNETRLALYHGDGSLFDQTEVGDPFYVVFYGKGNKDIIVFPKSDWEYLQ